MYITINTDFFKKPYLTGLFHFTLFCYTQNLFLNKDSKTKLHEQETEILFVTFTVLIS